MSPEGTPDYLLSAAAVRERCAIVFAAAVNVLVEAPVRALRSKVRQVAADSTAPQALSAANSIAPPSG